MANIFKNHHVNQRFFERVPLDISKLEITDALKDKNNVIFFKRETASKSKAYVLLLDTKIVKVIINRKSLQLVTILPWMDLFYYPLSFIKQCSVPGFTEDEASVYFVELYPDCYLETKTNKPLTTIYQNGIKLGRMHPLFDCVFDHAWNMFKQLKGENNENCNH